MATEANNSNEISLEFRAETLKNCLDSAGRAKVMPRKEKKKLVLLEELVKAFQSDKNYSEKEVNQVVQKMFLDYVSARRYLVEYGFLGRTADGKRYWKLLSTFA